MAIKKTTKTKNKEEVKVEVPVETPTAEPSSPAPKIISEQDRMSYGQNP